MPEPGSHAYEVRHRGARNVIDDQGTPDKNATEAANRQLRGDRPGPSRFSEGPRAGGPAGEHPREGGPGAVMPLRTAAFSDGAPIPGRYAHGGDNQPPKLEWSDVPAGAHELVLLCVDPDAPRGTFLHWLVTGIDPATTSYGGDAGTTGTAHRNGFGEVGYGGPRPPVGDPPHRYVFRLYALGEPFSADPGAPPDELRDWLDDHALATGTLTGIYQR